MIIQFLVSLADTLTIDLLYSNEKKKYFILNV